MSLWCAISNTCLCNKIIKAFHWNPQIYPQPPHQCLKLILKTLDFQQFSSLLTSYCANTLVVDIFADTERGRLVEPDNSGLVHFTSILRYGRYATRKKNCFWRLLHLMVQSAEPQNPPPADHLQAFCCIVWPGHRKTSPSPCNDTLAKIRWASKGICFNADENVKGGRKQVSECQQRQQQ